MEQKAKQAYFRTLSYLLDVKKLMFVRFVDLANQETDFMGVQSNLQSYFNYRSENKRLEMNFKLKSDKIKDFQKCFSSNSFYYNILKELCQIFW